MDASFATYVGRMGKPMTKLLFILLMPTILLGNTGSMFEDYIYKVDYLKNDEEESLQDVRFIGRFGFGTGSSLGFREIDGGKKRFYIHPRNVISVTDLQTNQVISDYYKLNKTIDKKSFENIAVPVLVVLLIRTLVLRKAYSKMKIINFN